MAQQRLGEVLSTSGAVLIADPEALAEWCEDHAAFAALSALAGEAVDEYELAIEGADALAAGRAFDRDWNPLVVHDATSRGEPELRRSFDALVSAAGFDARLVRLKERITHPERVRAALREGLGAGEISVAGLLCVVVAGTPGVLPVRAAPMPAGEHAGRFRHVTIALGPECPVARTEPAGYVSVESGSLVAIDPGALRSWKQLDDTRRALAAVAAGTATELELAGSRCTVFASSWGEGSFPVLVDRDAAGAPIRVRVDLGSDERVSMIRQLREAVSRPDVGHLAIVSARVAVDGEAIRWLYREAPERPGDSGWRIFAGDEDDRFLEDPDNARHVSLAEMRAIDPSLVGVLEAATGAAYERDEAGQSFREVTELERD